MSKKFITAIVAALATIVFSIFSLSNAFALQEEGASEESYLTRSVELCKAAKRSYARDIRGARAKGLSLQLSEEEITQMVMDIKARLKGVCSKDSSALTSAVQLCKEAQRNYGRDVKAARAKGLSLQLSKEEMKTMIQDIKDRKKAMCKEAKGQRSNSAM